MDSAEGLAQSTLTRLRHLRESSSVPSAIWELAPVVKDVSRPVNKFDLPHHTLVLSTESGQSIQAGVR